MDLYRPPKGGYIPKTHIKEKAIEHFEGTICGSYTSMVEIDSYSFPENLDTVERQAEGYILESELPVFERVIVASVFMGPEYEDWLCLDIDRVEDEEVKQILESCNDSTLDKMASAEERFATDLVASPDSLLQEIGFHPSVETAESNVHHSLLPIEADGYAVTEETFTE